MPRSRSPSISGTGNRLTSGSGDRKGDPSDLRMEFAVGSGSGGWGLRRESDPRIDSLFASGNAPGGGSGRRDVSEPHFDPTLSAGTGSGGWGRREPDPRMDPPNLRPHASENLQWGDLEGGAVGQVGARIVFGGFYVFWGYKGAAALYSFVEKDAWA